VPIDPPSRSRPGRIIVPGAGAPTDDVEASEAPRIVLPPGATREESDDLPEYPRLRPLEMIPIREGDRDYLLVTDPTGVLSSPVALGLEALELMQLLDGSVSLNELSTLVARESKDIRAARFVRDFVAQLDRLLLLDSPRYEEAFAQVRKAYHALEIRPAALEGVSYPADPREAGTLLGRHFEEAQKLHDGGPSAAVKPRALLVPHLDLRRAGKAIARGYLELERDPGAPSAGSLRVIVFGVGHALFGDWFALTRKHFETPFGKLPCDTAFVDAVASRLGDQAWRSELAHRDEHSIEFQALYVRHRFPDRAMTLVPILCGGFHALLDQGRGPRETEPIENLIQAVRDTERDMGGDTVYVASVDLSHVGTRFGDPALDDRTHGEVEDKDRTALEAARRGDADGWHAAIASHQDSTRICGWGATYAMLRCAEPGEGRLLHYEQSRENNGSLVSVATLVWP